MPSSINEYFDLEFNNDIDSGAQIFPPNCQIQFNVGSTFTQPYSTIFNHINHIQLHGLIFSPSTECMHCSSITTKNGIDRGITMGLIEGLKEGLKDGLDRGIDRGITMGLIEGLDRGIERGIR